jgi:hypothetical protein
MTKQQICYGSTQYQIKMKGRLGNQWSEWFEGMIIASDGGITTISGEVADQAALHGLLNRERDPPGLLLISATRDEPDQNSKKKK